MHYFSIAFTVLSLLLPHGDLDKRILEKTDQIALHPGDIQLYMERGELYLAHEEYLNAKADFSFCIEHLFRNTRVLLGISASLLNLNSLDSALAFVEQIEPNDEEILPTLELKGNILYRLGKYCDAAVNMELLLSKAPHPSPVLFLDAVRNLESCNKPGSNEREIELLNDGLRRVGQIRVLQKKLVFVYRQLGRYDEAVAAQTSIIESSDFTARAYFERAQLYVEMHLDDKAKQDLTTALSMIDNLPAYKNSVSPIENLRNELTALLNEFKK